MGGYQKIRFGRCMNVDGFISMPSFRPDGRLDRLNHGGGSKVPKTIPGEPAKVQKYPDFVRFLHLAAYQTSHGIKKPDVEMGYNIPPGMGKAKKAGGFGGGGAAAGSGGQVPKGPQGNAGGGGAQSSGMYTQEAAGAPVASAAAGTLKKKRTLLSGGGRAFGQPYGSETILGG